MISVKIHTQEKKKLTKIAQKYKKQIRRLFRESNEFWIIDNPDQELIEELKLNFPQIIFTNEEEDQPI